MILGAPWHGRGMPNVKKLVAIAVQTFARLFRIQCHVEHMYLEYIIRSNIYANKYECTSTPVCMYVTIESIYKIILGVRSYLYCTYIHNSAFIIGAEITSASICTRFFSSMEQCVCRMNSSISREYAEGWLIWNRRCDARIEFNLFCRVVFCFLDLLVFEWIDFGALTLPFLGNF